MNQEFLFALSIFGLSACTILLAAIMNIPIPYVALIPILAGVCISKWGGK